MDKIGESDPQFSVVTNADVHNGPGMAPLRLWCKTPKIIKACYGPGASKDNMTCTGNQANVTQTLQYRVDREKTMALPSGGNGGDGTWASWFPDPAYGQAKNLAVLYSCAQSCTDYKRTEKYGDSECMNYMTAYCPQHMEDDKCALWSNVTVKDNSDIAAAYKAAMDPTIVSWCRQHPSDPKCSCWKFQADLYRSMYGRSDTGGILPASCVAFGPESTTQNKCTLSGANPIYLESLAGGKCTATVKTCSVQIGTIAGSPTTNISCDQSGGGGEPPSAPLNNGIPPPPVSQPAAGGGFSMTKQWIKGVDNRLVLGAGGGFIVLLLLVVLLK